MRALLKIFLFCIGLVAFLLVTAFAWIFLYSRGLPDTSALARFAPAATTSVSDPCLKAASVAIPYESVGGNLRSAFSAVEVAESDPGLFTTMYERFTGKGRLSGRRCPHKSVGQCSANLPNRSTAIWTRSGLRYNWSGIFRGQSCSRFTPPRVFRRQFDRCASDFTLFLP